MSRWTPLSRRLILVVAAVLAAPAGASAATVSVSGGQLVYEAAAGEINNVELPQDYPPPAPGEESGEGALVLESGSAPLTIGAGCRAVPGGAACGTENEMRAIVRLGDRNDRFMDLRYPSTNGVEVEGGSGNDELGDGGYSSQESTFDGGSGNDRISVGSGTVAITGGDGDDTIRTREGGPTITIDAGKGDDAVTFDSYYSETDSSVALGAGNDTLTLPNSIWNSNYADLRQTPYGAYEPSSLPESAIDGGAGVDKVVMTSFTGHLIFDLSAAQTNLEIVDGTWPSEYSDADGVSRFGGNLLIGSDGYEVFRGGPGPDVIVPGGKRDWVNAGGGDDVILAKDGGPDHIVCGAGTDLVRVDRADLLLRRDCEKPFLGVLPEPLPYD